MALPSSGRFGESAISSAGALTLAGEGTSNGVQDSVAHQRDILRRGEGSTDPGHTSIGGHRENLRHGDRGDVARDPAPGALMASKTQRLKTAGAFEASLVRDIQRYLKQQAKYLRPPSG